MANSLVIQTAKNKIIKEFIKDNEIILAIDSSTIKPKTPEKLIDTHIFNFHQNPNTINTSETFITVQIHLSQSSLLGNTFIKYEVELWIISHENHMKVDNVPKVKANRNDYLSELIDLKLNGRSDFGIGTLSLKSNIEGSYQQGYLYRKMVFEGTDFNDSVCDDE